MDAVSDVVREAVAQAIYRAQYPNWSNAWDEVGEDGHAVAYVFADAAIAAYLSALGEGGYTLVKHPEPSYTDEPEDGLPGIGFNGGPADHGVAVEHGVYVFDGMVYDQYDRWTPEQARKIGSWWIAAAAEAEK